VWNMSRTCGTERRARAPGNSTRRDKGVKFDRQIVAVATVEGATAVYSDDSHVVGYAREAGMEAYRLADLLPPNPWLFAQQLVQRGGAGFGHWQPVALTPRRAVGRRAAG
jgi:hypothetical protein